MRNSFRETVISLSSLKDLKLIDWLPLLFGVWLLLCITMPSSIYRAFFHILILPLTIYLVAKQYNKPIFKDNFIRLFLIFCLYMAITTWLVGNDALYGNIQASRWGVEAFLGILAFWLWMQHVISHPRLWGRLLLLFALTGTVSALFSANQSILANERIGGLGIMSYPIQGASISIILLTIGIFLTLRNGHALEKVDKLIVVLAILSVCTFVALSQSRAPQVTLLAYLIFLVFFVVYNKRHILTFFIISLTFFSLLISIHWLVGFELFFEQFKERGMSYRLDIWTAILENPPESILIGHGAGLDFSQTGAAIFGLGHLDFEVRHAHNIWLGTYIEMGFVGIAMLTYLVAMPVFSVLKNNSCLSSKVYLLTILGIFLMLTMSDEYTLLISIHPIWLIGWLPLIFVWSWSKYKSQNPD